MIDKLITIGRFLQVPPNALRYAMVMALTVLVTAFGTRKYMQASAGFEMMAQVAAVQSDILEELKHLRLQNDSLKNELLTERQQRHNDIKSIATVMKRSFNDVIDVMREFADGNRVLQREVDDMEAHIEELFDDKIKLEVQLRKKRPPPVYKGRIVSEEIDNQK